MGCHCNYSQLLFKSEAAHKYRTNSCTVLVDCLSRTEVQRMRATAWTVPQRGHSLGVSARNMWNEIVSSSTQRSFFTSCLSTRTVYGCESESHFRKSLYTKFALFKKRVVAQMVFTRFVATLLCFIAGDSFWHDHKRW